MSPVIGAIAQSRVLPPQGWWEYAIVAVAAAIALVAVVWLVVAFFRPGEDDPDHIKYSILERHPTEPEREP